MVIKQMKPLGFSLEEMAEILGLLANGPGAPGSAARLAGILEQAAHQRAKMARNLAQADDFIAMLGASPHRHALPPVSGTPANFLKSDIFVAPGSHELA